MKKTAALVLLTAAMAAHSCSRKYPVAQSDVAVVSREGSLTRGHNLTMAVCAPCHFDKETQSFTGKEVFGMPRLAGRLFSSNITQSSTHGSLSKYSDGALIYLIRTGITYDGRFIPYMMRPNIADEDINDIIVFLRSADPSVRARDTTTGRTGLTAAGKIGQRILLEPQPFSSGIARPPASDSIGLGRYLVDNIGCYHCHSRSVMSLDYRHPEQSKGYLAGGTKFVTREGKIRTPNIRFDSETGIGDYTREDLRRVLQEGIGRDGHRLRAPAEIFYVSDKESDAIYAYLKSLPAVHHKVKGQRGPSREAFRTVAR